MEAAEKEKLIKKTVNEVGRYLASGFDYIGIKEHMDASQVVEYKGTTYDVKVSITKRK